MLAFLVAVMVACWSLNFIFGKVALRYWSPLTLAAFRVELAGLIMLPIYLFFRSRKPPGAAAERPRAGFDRRDFWTFAQLGFLGVGVNQICFTIGLNYTTVGHSALIIGMGPILIMLLARLQGLEALTVKKLLGMAIAFGGVIVLASEHGLSLRSGTLRGDLITFVGALAFSLYTVQGKKVAGEYDTIAMNAFNYFFGAVVVLPLAAYQALRLGRTTGWSAVPWQGWAALVYMAGFASVLAYVIYFWVLRHMTAARLGAFGYLHPVLTTVMGIVLLGEKLTGHVVLGGGLVLVGVYLIESEPRENKLKENSVKE